MSLARAVYHHAWQNFLMPDRLDQYRALLRLLVERGYTFRTVEEFAGDVRAERATGRVCVLRNDVDSDPAGAGRMFEIDQAEGVRATYYFRLSTIDRALIARMQAANAEVGYHYEELATFAKQAGLRSKTDVEQHIGAVRNAFRRNVERFRAASGVSPRTIAAHGDFANRRLGVTNNHVIDRRLMEEFGIVAETYEPWLMSAVNARVADRAAPEWWHPSPPEVALRKDPAVIYILVHPRQWVRAPMRNLGLDVARGADGVRYAVNRLMRSRR
jgi:peptidoglycan/xylan/chitin deacetylase (PgdA/CDA1 family)